METYTGWHFFPADNRLPYGDGRLVEVGTITVEGGRIKACELGLHASVKPLDALRNYQHGGNPGVAYVTLRGELDVCSDKAAARERTVHWLIKSADLTCVLHEFACWCAERALQRERVAGREPDVRLWRAIEYTRSWLRGNNTLEELQQARKNASSAASSASAAASNAASSAAYAAAAASSAYYATAYAAAAASFAYYAAASSASSAAFSAAFSAFSAAASSAAYHTAQRTEYDQQNIELERLLMSFAPVASAEGART